MSRRTSHKVLAPSPASGRLDHTYESALLAEVAKLFWASSWIPPETCLALPTGAQKWLRDPASENARVVRWRPAAISFRTDIGPSFSITAVPA